MCTGTYVFPRQTIDSLNDFRFFIRLYFLLKFDNQHSTTNQSVIFHCRWAFLFGCFVLLLMVFIILVCRDDFTYKANAQFKRINFAICPLTYTFISHLHMAITFLLVLCLFSLARNSHNNKLRKADFHTHHHFDV